MGNALGKFRKRGREESSEEEESSSSSPEVKRQRLSSNDDEEEAPSFFTCPITREAMYEPVVLLTAGSGQSFERGALEKWLQKHPLRDPLTNEIHERPLAWAPNRALQEALVQWRTARGLPLEAPDDFRVPGVDELEALYPGVGAHVAVLLERESTPRGRVEAASAIATHCAEHGAEGAEAAREAGAIPPLVAMLEGAPEVAAAAAFSLGCVSQSSTENRSAVREAGGVRPLVALVSRSSSNDGSPQSTVSRVFAAGVLVSLACDDASRADIVQSGGVDALVRVLVDADDDTVVPAACALYNVTNDRDSGARDAVVRAGAVPALLRFLAAPSRPTTAAPPATSPQRQDDGARGMMMMTATAMTTSATAPTSQQLAAALATGDVTIRHVAIPEMNLRAGPGGTFVFSSNDQLRDDDDDTWRPRQFGGEAQDEVQDCAAGVLLHLSTRDEDNRGKTAIMEAGGFEVLLDVVRRRKAADSVLGRVLATLIRAAEVEDLQFQKAVIAADAADVLAGFLVANHDRLDGRRCVADNAHFNAVVLTFHLACDGGEGFVAPFLAHGGVKALVDCAHDSGRSTDDDDDVVSAQRPVWVEDREAVAGMATLALYPLSASHAVLEEIVAAGGVEVLADLVVRAASSADQTHRTRTRGAAAGVLERVILICDGEDADRTCKAILAADALPAIFALLSNAAFTGVVLTLLRAVVVNESVADHHMSDKGDLDLLAPFFSDDDDDDDGEQHQPAAAFQQRRLRVDAALVAVHVAFGGKGAGSSVEEWAFVEQEPSLPSVEVGFRALRVLCGSTGDDACGERTFAAEALSVLSRFPGRLRDGAATCIPHLAEFLNADDPQVFRLAATTVRNLVPTHRAQILDTPRVLLLLAVVCDQDAAAALLDLVRDDAHAAAVAVAHGALGRLAGAFRENANDDVVAILDAIVDNDPAHADAAVDAADTALRLRLADAAHGHLRAKARLALPRAVRTLI